jgi:triose/dihydroxyacetone kinase / FAD-AMP lyase (cyclizing)
MSHFINTKETLVTEAIDGFLRTSGNADLARLDGFPQIKVIVNTAHANTRVAVISGGGSGHEPSHAGFVGKGMLAAAVCGEVFASPSVDAVLAGILAVTGKAGCLLVVKNYTGDRLNFGLAAEKARGLGFKVEMVVVGDDIALPDINQPRGVAGTLFVHKIAGYFAMKGAKLDKVAEIARAVAGSTVSIGLSLSSCSIPGVDTEDRVPEGKAELGLGIHGEPGAELVAFEGAAQTAAILVDRLFAAAKPAKHYMLLLNNLGATTALEMSVIAHEILKNPKAKKIKLMVGPSPLMTALDMHGLSASMLPLNEDYETAMMALVGPSAWPGTKMVAKPNLVKMPKDIKAVSAKASKNAGFAAMLETACDTLIGAEADLNLLDSKIGDGDTGSTMAGAARNLKAVINKLPLANNGDAFVAISNTLTATMGGSSGVLLAILFAAAGVAANEGHLPAKALQAGFNKMKHYGGANLGDRTMVDALEPALDALVAGKGLAFAANAARKGALATAKMKSAKAGRASYVSAKNLGGVIDPGAEAAARVVEALAAMSRS